MRRVVVILRCDVGTCRARASFSANDRASEARLRGEGWVEFTDSARVLCPRHGRVER